MPSLVATDLIDVRLPEDVFEDGLPAIASSGFFLALAREIVTHIAGLEEGGQRTTEEEFEVRAAALHEILSWHNLKLVANMYELAESVLSKFKAEVGDRMRDVDLLNPDCTTACLQIRIAGSTGSNMIYLLVPRACLGVERANPAHEGGAEATAHPPAPHARGDDMRVQLVIHKWEDSVPA